MSIIKTTNLNLTKNILLCLYTKFNTNEYKLTAASTCTGRCKSDLLVYKLVFVSSLLSMQY
jgi:hypothetical protein